MMHYEGLIIRHPCEPNSILLQSTGGCSHRKGTFCGAYPGQHYSNISDEFYIKKYKRGPQTLENHRKVAMGNPPCFFYNTGEKNGGCQPRP